MQDSRASETITIIHCLLYAPVTSDLRTPSHCTVYSACGILGTRAGNLSFAGSNRIFFRSEDNSQLEAP